MIKYYFPFFFLLFYKIIFIKRLRHPNIFSDIDCWIFQNIFLKPRPFPPIRYSHSHLTTSSFASRRRRRFHFYFFVDARGDDVDDVRCHRYAGGYQLVRWLAGKSYVCPRVLGRVGGSVAWNREECRGSSRY